MPDVLTLAAWMAANSYDDESLAKRAKTDRTTISRLRRGKQRPSWALMDRLKKITGGQITAASFDLGAPESQRRRARAVA